MSNPFTSEYQLAFNDPEWGYKLGHHFLRAAALCGFSCDRVFVAEGTEVEGLPLGCPCQLAVIVVTGLSEPRQEGPAMAGGVCTPVFTASVRLVLDLCVAVPGRDEVPRPAALDEAGLVNQRRLWQIMQGLLKARAAGELGGFGARVAEAGWDPVTTVGGSARWQTVWSYRQ